MRNSTSAKVQQVAETDKLRLWNGGGTEIVRLTYGLTHIN